MIHFKQHAKEEISLQAPVGDHTHQTHPLPDNTLVGGSSACVLSLRGKGGLESGGQEESAGKPPTLGDTYKLVFLGKYKMAVSVNTGSEQVELIDVLVTKVKETLAARAATSLGGARKSIGSRLLSRTGKPSPSFLRKSSLGKPPPGKPPPGDSDRRASEGDQGRVVRRKKGGMLPSTGREDVLSTSAPSSMLERIARQSREKDEDSSSTRSEEGGPVQTDIPPRSHDNGDFDTIPELGNLQRTEEFRALSGAAAVSASLEADAVEKSTVNVKVLLHFTGINVLAVAEESSNIIFKKTIKTITCCAQVLICWGCGLLLPGTLTSWGVVRGFRGVASMNGVHLLMC